MSDHFRETFSATLDISEIALLHPDWVHLPDGWTNHEEFPCHFKPPR